MTTDTTHACIDPIRENIQAKAIALCPCYADARRYYDRALTLHEQAPSPMTADALQRAHRDFARAQALLGAD